MQYLRITKNLNLAGFEAIRDVTNIFSRII